MSILRQLTRKIRGPRCYLDAEEKSWIDQRLLWLRQQFGSGPIRRPPLEPGSELLPTRWNQAPEDGVELLQKLCGYMQVDPNRLELQYYSEDQPIEPIPGFTERESSGPAGLYIHPDGGNRLIIALHVMGLRNPANLVATMCHELGHVHLLADKRIAHDDEDGEPLTDLLTVYFGAGIFPANSAFQFGQWQDGNYGGWSVSRQGYLTEAQFGYALACYCWFRGETAADWRRHLRENIAYYFDESMHFLGTTRDTLVPFDGA